jgi:homoserine O-acetyltransferase
LSWDIKKEISSPKNYNIDEFTFESGDSLDNLNVEYVTLGTPELDSDNNLINGVLYLHGWGGSCTSMKRLDPITGPEKPLDPEEVFIISPTALGSPGSSAPSTTSLGPNFPKYTITDMVNFHYEFLKEKFSIEHLKGVIGTSMGGFLALNWAVNYADYMDFLIPLVSSYQVKGLNFANFYFMNSLIEKDLEYNGGNYEKNPERVTRLVSEFMYMFGLSKDYYRYELENKDILKYMNQMGIEGSSMDANDIIWRNNAAMGFDLENELSKISVKTLILAINQDQYFPPSQDAIPMSKMIKNSKIALFDSICGHIGTKDLYKVENDIITFLKEFF